MPLSGMATNASSTSQAVSNVSDSLVPAGAGRAHKSTKATAAAVERETGTFMFVLSFRELTVTRAEEMVAPGERGTRIEAGQGWVKPDDPLFQWLTRLR